ncbi:MAG: homocysteine S-methyltransferase family protein [Pseudomonadota bacterium]
MAGSTSEKLYTSVQQHMLAGGLTLLDGGTGTELEALGAPMHDETWCAMANETAPQLVCEVHRQYIRAGARIIATNTFSTNRNMLEPAGLGDRFNALNESAVAEALRARSLEKADDRVLVAGCMSHQVPIKRGTGDRIERAVPPIDVARARFDELANLLTDGGVDLIMLEMMSHPELANEAIEAARATGLPIWVGFSVRADDAGNPVSLSKPALAAADMFDAIDLDGVDVAGVMHSSVNLTGPALELLRARYDGPLSAYPDSGFFRMPHWQFEDIIPPADLVEQMAAWTTLGVRAIGGCCGLGVTHIEAMKHGFAERLGP